MRQPSTGVLVVTATAESTGRGPALLFAHDPDPIPDVLANRYGVRAGLDLHVGRTRQ
jgi:hypothetical protein